jgi:ribosome-associated protein
VIKSSALKESFVRSSGPGGQNVNKVNSAVELRLDLNAAGLEEELRARVEKLAGHRLSVDGVIVIHAHEFRTQLQNREAARERLIALIARAARRPRKRTKTKRPVIANEHRLAAKHRRGDLKRGRATQASEE